MSEGQPSQDYFMGRIEGVVEGIFRELKAIRENHSAHETQIEKHGERLTAVENRLLSIDMRFKIYTAGCTAISAFIAFGVHEAIVYFK